MPTVPVYIRKEDWNKWITIEKPSEFIHNALNAKGIVDLALGEQPASKGSSSTNYQTSSIENIKENKDGTISIKDSSKPAVVKNKPFKADTCKQHGIDKNLCRMMKHD